MIVVVLVGAASLIQTQAKFKREQTGAKTILYAGETRLILHSTEPGLKQ